jgi:xylulose-5-phosphate/fructose-6-phosphate phosphoketolase
MKLQSNRKHPHGLSNAAFDKLFTVDKPVIFNFHGYPSLIHELTYDRSNQDIHVHGYQEEGTITTPFDMRVLNKIDRYHIILDVLKYVELEDEKEISDYCKEKLSYHRRYIKKYGIDMPEIREL